MIQYVRTRRISSSHIIPAVFLAFLTATCTGPDKPETRPVGASRLACETAAYALNTHRNDVVDTLARLVSFETVNVNSLPTRQSPEFREMTEFLRAQSEELGFDFSDFGDVVVIGIGEGPEKLGLITHGDVQPADASKWVKSPYELDMETEPGRLVGRGVEDDKGPIAITLFAMKSLAEREIPLTRRIELIVSYTEESDWNPMLQFLNNYRAPEWNIALDSKFPVVTAEKGFCLIRLSLPFQAAAAANGGGLVDFTGGAFVSQIPEEASAVIANPDETTRDLLRRLAESGDGVRFSVETKSGTTLTVTAHGRSAHSSEPEEGVNAVAHLAEFLKHAGIGGGSSGLMVDFISRYVGTGYHAEQFGDIAYSHDFMGPLTLALTKLERQQGRHILSLNLRRPAGKSDELLERQIRRVVDAWKKEQSIEDLRLDLYLGEPHLVENAPQVPVLLGIFSQFTGIKNPEPLSSGGGTHARLFPNGVSFGPHMPGRPYSGHTEHEFLSLEELELDIQMYTAMLVDLAAAGSEFR